MSRVGRSRRTRVRATLQQPEQKGSAITRLRRTLWGLSAKEVERRMRAQHREFTRARDRLVAELNLLLMEQQSLEARLDQLYTRQLQLAGALQEEAVQPDAGELAQAAAQLEQEREGVQELAAALYRVLADRGAAGPGAAGPGAAGPALPSGVSGRPPNCAESLQPL